MCGKNTATFGAYFVQYTWHNNSASSNMLILCIFGSMLVCISKSTDAVRGFSIKDQSIGDGIAFFV